MQKYIYRLQRNYVEFRYGVHIILTVTSYNVELLLDSHRERNVLLRSASWNQISGKNQKRVPKASCHGSVE